MIAALRMRPRGDEVLISGVVDFWKDVGAQGRWFDKDEGFDHIFRDRYLDLHMAVAARRYDGWIEHAKGALALLILTDQFPRNAFRRDRPYVCRPTAWRGATPVWRSMPNILARVSPDLRLFFSACRFAHSEDIADQDISVELNARLGRPARSRRRATATSSAASDAPHPLISAAGARHNTQEAEFLEAGGFQG